MSQNEEDISKHERIITQDNGKEWKDGWVTPPPVVGRRILKFPDNTQVAVDGLVEIMADLYAEDRKVTHETAQEIINKLEEKKNYIPSSEQVRREYVYVLRQEYEKYIKDR